MSILIVIQARMGSTRLPGKVLLNLHGKPIIQHVLDACNLWPTMLAIPNTPMDMAILSGTTVCHAGSENDVLDRIYSSTVGIYPDNVVRITADCPMLTRYIITDVIQQHIDNQNDFTYNSDMEQGDGIDVEVMKMSVLKECHEQANSAYDREHVTTWIRNNPKFKKQRVAVPDYPTRSINTLDDYVWVHQHWRKE
jgi:spore coat polysaccharide biosynthesis protein SpsF (cytidylyltransferase family)